MIRVARLIKYRTTERQQRSKQPWELRALIRTYTVGKKRVENEKKKKTSEKEKKTLWVDLTLKDFRGFVRLIKLSKPTSGQVREVAHVSWDP